MKGWGISKKLFIEEAVESKAEIIVREPAVLEVVENRIYFYAEVGRTQILKLNRELRSMNNCYITRAQTLGDGHLTPIFLHISSYGGSIFSGFSMLKTAVYFKVTKNVLQS